MFEFDRTALLEFVWDRWLDSPPNSLRERFWKFLLDVL